MESGCNFTSVGLRKLEEDSSGSWAAVDLFLRERAIQANHREYLGDQGVAVGFISPIGTNEVPETSESSSKVQLYHLFQIADISWSILSKVIQAYYWEYVSREINSNERFSRDVRKLFGR